MKRVLAGMLLVLFVAGTCRAGGLSAGWKVGVFNPMLAGGSGDSCLKIMDVLRQELDLDVSAFGDLRGVTNYQATVFSCVVSVGEQPDDWKSLLRAYVENGGGVVLIHDSCGRMHALSPPLFPEVVDTSDRLIRNAGVKALVAHDHPVAEGIENIVFQLDQYPEMKAGPHGTTVMRTEADMPVAIAGNWELGRVVGIGTIPGWTTADPGHPENRLLINSVYWAAGAPMRDERIAAFDGPEMMRQLRREVILLQRRLNSLEQQVDHNRRASENARQLRIAK